MPETAHKRYLAIHKAIETDGEYLFLQAQLRDNAPLFAAVMDSLTPQQQEIITQHLGICAQLQERTVEIACFLP